MVRLRGESHAPCCPPDSGAALEGSGAVRPGLTVMHLAKVPGAYFFQARSAQSIIKLEQSLIMDAHLRGDDAAARFDAHFHP